MNLPVERFAWVCLGKPSIPGVGEQFVNELGKNKCIARYLEFMKRYWGQSENIVEPLDFKLR